MLYGPIFQNTRRSHYTEVLLQKSTLVIREVVRRAYYFSNCRAWSSLSSCSRPLSSIIQMTSSSADDDWLLKQQGSGEGGRRPRSQP